MKFDSEVSLQLHPLPHCMFQMKRICFRNTFLRDLIFVLRQPHLSFNCEGAELLLQSSLRITLHGLKYKMSLVFPGPIAKCHTFRT
jgi:hypothetical protein